MSEPSAPQFEHQTIEADIARLKAEINTRRELPEAQKLSGHEVLRNSLRSYTGSGSPIPTPPPPPPPPKDDKSPFPAYLKDAPLEVRLKVEKLVDRAFHEGILKVNKEAKESGPFVLDAFHDALTGKLYPEFKRRGILE